MPLRHEHEFLIAIGALAVLWYVKSQGGPAGRLMPGAPLVPRQMVPMDLGEDPSSQIPFTYDWVPETGGSPNPGDDPYSASSILDTPTEGPSSPSAEEQAGTYTGGP